jgi:hypothetical protein
MWVDRRGEDPELIETLDENLNILYNDSSIAESPEEYIGSVLHDHEEVRALRRFGDVLSDFLDSLPPNMDDAAVIALPEWNFVVAEAVVALQVLLAHDT